MRNCFSFLLLLSISWALQLQKPAVVVPFLGFAGDDFELLVSHSSTPTGLTATILGNECSYSLVPETPAFDGTYWRIWCSVPMSVEHGIYDLVITLGSVADTQIHAICVVEDMPTSFTILHITDPHFGTTGTGHVDNRERVKKVVELVNPAFIMLTGDITDTGTQAQFREFLTWMHGITAPVFGIPGNHDWNNIANYKSLLTEIVDYSFDYGNTHIVMLDSGNDNGSPLWQCYGFTTAQLDWFVDDMDAHVGAAHYIVGTHGPFFDELTPNVEGRDDFVRLCGDYGVAAVLAGHTHLNKIFDAAGTRHTTSPFTPFAGTIFLETASCAKTAVYNMRRDVRILKITPIAIDFLTADDNLDGSRDAEAAWTIMRWDIVKTDFPTRDSFVAIVTNSHAEDFLQSRAIFASLDTGHYSCDGGIIVHRFPDGSAEVFFTFEAATTETISIFRGSSGISEKCEQNRFSEISVFPNPFYTRCHITLPQNSCAEIFDISGKLVQSHNGEREFYFELSAEFSGMFFVRVRTENAVFIKKLILLSH